MVTSWPLDVSVWSLKTCYTNLLYQLQQAPIPLTNLINVIVVKNDVGRDLLEFDARGGQLQRGKYALVSFFIV